MENIDPDNMSKRQLENFEREAISLRNELCLSNKFPGPASREQMVPNHIQIKDYLRLINK